MTDTGDMRALFETLLDAGPDARAEMLDRQEPRIAARLRAMLDADASYGDGEQGDAPIRTYPWPGDRVGAYRLVAPIGSGGMGSVWISETIGAADVQVAVKFASGARVDADEARERLLRETAVLARLAHASVVPVVAAGDAGAVGPYLAMPLLPGRTFDAFARELRGRPDAAERFAACVARIAAALDHVHARGFVHRDVKPANLLVDDDGVPVLIDFGVARAVDATTSASAFVTSSVAPHTPAFASPEQAAGDDASYPADVFALGKLVRAGAESAGLPIDRPLDAVIARACADDPSERPESAGAVGRAVVAWAAPRAKRGGGLRATIGGMLIGAAVAASAALALRPSGSDSDALTGALTETLRTTSADELPGDPDLYVALAESEPDGGWAVVAAHHALRDGRPVEALEFADAAIAAAEGGGLPARRALELARLLADLGRNGDAFTLAEHAADGELDEEQRLEAGVLQFELFTREAGGERSLLAGLAGDLEALAEEADVEAAFELPLEELDAADAGARLFLATLAAGHPAAVEHWAAEAEDEEWRRPGEGGDRVASLLLLHARLEAAGAARPLRRSTLRALDEELWSRYEEDDELRALRPWCIVRALRAADALERDTREALEWTNEATERLEEADGLPRDGAALVAAVRAHALARLDEPFEEARRLALDLATSAGLDLREHLEAWSPEDGASALVAGRWDADWAGAVTEALDESERGAPWWAR